MTFEGSRTARFAGVIVLAASTALGAACGGSNNTSTVTAPTGTLVTDTFNGTVAVGGSDAHNFTITTPGNALNVTLLSTAPQTTLTMGLGVGTPSSTGTCSILPNGSITTPAGSVAQLTGSNFGAGTYCVVVVDIGNAAGPITYTVTVAHT
jgi:hypothetical protein